MHSGGPFSLHTPFPDLWEFEPGIDYQSLSGQKPGVFTDVYKFAQGKKSGAIFAGGRLLLHELFHQGEGCLILLKLWILCLNELETEVVTGFSVLARLKTFN